MTPEVALADTAPTRETLLTNGVPTRENLLADGVPTRGEPLADGGPAVLACALAPARTVSETVAALLALMEGAAIASFPAWLPAARAITGPGGTGVPAVRALAFRAAAAGRHHGPFLADLAEAALRARPPSRQRFAARTRAVGLARVLAEAAGRPHAAIVLEVPAGLTAAEEDVLVTACEWLAGHGGLAVGLTGAPLASADRVPEVPIALPRAVTAVSVVPEAPEAPNPSQRRPEVPPRPSAPLGRPGLVLPASPIAGPLTRPVPETLARSGPETPAWTGPGQGVARLPAAAGVPHPGSRAEKALEAALSSRPWAAGRVWNQTYRPHPLANPIRVDLMWRRERCVVEIDGPEHRSLERSKDDGHRDAWLREDGYAVLRVTNDQVLTDIEAVVGRVERFLLSRRHGKTPEGR
ncbi:endonuclease domain-containing protein [Sphaerisporangium melleum]|nr:DUF559 domain-containing protein [Sphaerisporangium melleum]